MTGRRTRWGKDLSGAGPAPPPPGGDSPAARTVPDLGSPRTGTGRFSPGRSPGYAPLRQPEGATVPPRTAADARRAPGPDAAHQPATMIVARQPQAAAVREEAAPDVVQVRAGGSRQPGRAAESVWRTGLPPGPPRQVRLRRLRRCGTGAHRDLACRIRRGAVPAVLSPVVQVTGAASRSRRRPAARRRDRADRHERRGRDGLLPWLFKPAGSRPRALRQSVTSGQHAVDVTVAVEGSGHGSASQTAILQVLGPDRQTASTRVALSC